MNRPRIAFVSREVQPLDAGGIGTHVTAQADILSEVADVTIFTRAGVAADHARLVRSGDPRLPSERVQVCFIPEAVPRASLDWFGVLHEWSASAYRALLAAYPDGGPDLVEFPDYHGEGAVTVQARLTRDPALWRTTVGIRLCTTSEMCRVLNGLLPTDLHTRVAHGLERFALRHADVVMWPGGDVLGTYERFFGPGGLAPARLVRPTIRLPASAPAEPQPGQDDGPLRLLYLGRYERRKGVQNLVRALTALPQSGWSLTMVGDDTNTGPLRSSVRAQLEAMTRGHPQFRFLEAVPRTEIGGLIARHHAVIVPSLWECWPNVGLEALACNRPLIASPVGGLTEMTGAGPGGWGDGGRVLDAPSVEAVAVAVEALLADRAPLTERIADGRPRRRFEALASERDVVGAYLALATESQRALPRSRPRRAPAPLISVVVPYYRLERYVEETVRSALDQEHPHIEVVIVNDGSLRPQDAILDRLAEDDRVRVVCQPNSGLGRARNLGIAVSRGRFVLPLDADNVILPGFCTRALAVLEADPSTAWVSSWLRFIDSGGQPRDDAPSHYHPLGSEPDLLDRRNTAADAVALIRRSVFDGGFAYDPDMASYEDWLLYAQLRDAGHVGHVIPEPLVLYRVRAESMLRDVGARFDEALVGERLAHRRERRVWWTAPAT